MAKLGEVFTLEELEGFIGLQMAPVIYDNITDTHMDKLSVLTGQENDRMYMSYMLEHQIDKGFSAESLSKLTFGPIN